MSKRLSISKGAKRKPDKRQKLFSKLTKKNYAGFKGAIGRLCDDMLKTKLEKGQIEKIARLRAKIEIEM